jgi:hypothetical protein
VTNDSASRTFRGHRPPACTSAAIRAVLAANAGADVLRCYNELNAAFEKAREHGNVTPLMDTVRRWWSEWELAALCTQTSWSTLSNTNAILTSPPGQPSYYARCISADTKKDSSRFWCIHWMTSCSSSRSRNFARPQIFFLEVSKVLCAEGESATLWVAS